MTAAILNRLRGLSDSDWMPQPPATKTSLTALENKYHLTLPNDYRDLMLNTSGFGLYGHSTQLNLESSDELLWLNDDPDYTECLPGMFVIGNDNSDALFYYDTTNRLGKGTFSIFQVDYALIGFPYSKYAAASLTGLIEAILANKEIWEYPYLGPLNHPDRAE